MAGYYACGAFICTKGFIALQNYLPNIVSSCSLTVSRLGIILV